MAAEAASAVSERLQRDEQEAREPSEQQGIKEALNFEKQFRSQTRITRVDFSSTGIKVQKETHRAASLRRSSSFNSWGKSGWSLERLRLIGISVLQCRFGVLDF